MSQSPPQVDGACDHDAAPAASMAMSAPTSFDEARSIEEAGLNHLQSRRQLFYDGWLLFLLAGEAKRARSVNPHFGSSLPLPRKIAHCETLYARHGLSTLFRITPFAQPVELDAALAARGYLAFDPTFVQIAPLDRPTTIAGPPDVQLRAPLIDAFVEAVGEMRGSPAPQRSAHLERLAQSPLQIHTVVARVDGRDAGAGLIAIEGDTAGVFDVVTHHGFARRGVATAMVAALVDRAWERGARRMYLQVSASNVPALHLYRRFGFATLYTYHYRARPDECE